MDRGGSSKRENSVGMRKEPGIVCFLLVLFTPILFVCIGQLLHIDLDVELKGYTEILKSEN